MLQALPQKRYGALAYFLLWLEFLAFRSSRLFGQNACYVQHLVEPTRLSVGIGGYVR